MGKLLERLKRGREKLKQRAEVSRAKREIKQATNLQIQKQKSAEAEIRFEEKAQKIISRQERISKVREAQLRREKAEAGIIQARARKFKARRVIIGKPMPSLRLQGPIIQSRTSATGLSFTTTKKTKKKKKIKQIPVGPTPGLGRFRVI